VKGSRRLLFCACILVITILITPSATLGIFTPNDTFWDDVPNPADDLQYGPEQINTDHAWDLTDEDTFSNPGSSCIIIAIIDSTLANHNDIPVDMLWTNPNEVDGDPGATHYPGAHGVDDDAKGDGIDFFDEDFDEKTFDGDTDFMWGPDRECNVFWDAGAGRYDWLDNPPLPHDDDLGDYPWAAQDDDENGYYDDIHGWDFGERDDTIDDGFNYHGTHVAGIAAAAINNDLGIAGISQVDLMFLAVEGYTSNQDFVDVCEDAVQYAIDMGADVISTSWFLPVSVNQLQDEADTAENAGILWVSAAGNTYGGAILSPANYDNVMAIGSSNQANDGFPNQHRSGFSARGAGLDVLAPGNDIWSTYGPPLIYQSLSGTSMATPHVSGVASLVLAYRPSLTRDELYRILAGTADDITDAALPNPKRDVDADFGRDVETGWGEVNASVSLAYANSMRQKWQGGSIIQSNSVTTGEMRQPSIALDSEGYSHIVWIDDSNGFNEVFYASKYPSGQQWCSPNGLSQQDSRYPDVYIDENNNVHVAWIERWFDPEPRRWTYDIYYEKLDTSGQNLVGPVLVTSSTNSREYINIYTDQNSDPTIVYGEFAGGDWDIKWVHFINGWWGAPLWITNDNNIDQRKPSADILEDDNTVYTYIGYQRQNRIDPNDHWEIWMWNNWAQPVNLQITNNDVDDINPNLCTERHWGFVNIVWTAEDIDDNRDQVRLCVIDGGEIEAITYPDNPNGPGLRWCNVGGPSSNTVGEDVKDFPKVSATEITNPRGGGEAARAIQITVIWREYSTVQTEWWAFGSILTWDGRCLTPDDQTLLFPCYDGIPQITGSEIRAVDNIDDWLDCDGNFRLLYYQEDGPNLHLFLASTRELWMSTVSLTNSEEHTQIYPHMDIDGASGLHIVYQTLNDVTNNNEIYYGYWPGGNRNPNLDPWFLISDSAHDCVRPQVIGRLEGMIPEGIVVYKDLDEGQNGELMWTRFKSDGSTTYARTTLGCVDTQNQANEPFDHRIVHCSEKLQIGIIWSEWESAQRNLDVHFGIVNIFNIEALEETNSTVDGSTGVDRHPDIEVDLVGDYHIVYTRQSVIYYNGVHYDSPDYEKMYANDIRISETDVQSDYPSIAIDLELHRRADPAWGGIEYNHTTLGQTNRFIHITFSRYRSTEEDYILRYVKIDDAGELIIPEKDVTGLALNRNSYYSDTHIISQIVLNEENQVGIVYYGKMHHGSSWPALDPRYAVFFSKLDNNGEVITIETYISNDRLLTAMSCWADYNNDKIWRDANDPLRVEVIWIQSGTIHHRMEVGWGF